MWLSTLSTLAVVGIDFTNVLSDGGGVGLAAYSLASNGGICSLGVAGTRINGTEEAMPSDAASRFHHGSVTKSMTSTLLAILLHDGTIDGTWDSTLQTVLPMAVGTAYAGVTLRQLVSMQSGLAANPDWWAYEQMDSTSKLHFESAPQQRPSSHSVCARTPPAGTSGRRDSGRMCLLWRSVCASSRAPSWPPT